MCRLAGGGSWESVSNEAPTTDSHPLKSCAGRAGEYNSHFPPLLLGSVMLACLCSGWFLKSFISILFTTPSTWFTLLAFLWKYMEEHTDQECSLFLDLLHHMLTQTSHSPIFGSPPCQKCNELSEWKKMLLLQLDIAMQFNLIIYLLKKGNVLFTNPNMSFLFFLKPFPTKILSANFLFFSTSLCAWAVGHSSNLLSFFTFPLKYSSI